MLKLKFWFVEKDFTRFEKQVLEICEEPKVLRETEKALLIEFDAGYSGFTKWVPKSAVEDDTAIRLQREMMAQSHQKYQELVDWAKRNGVKGVRSGMKIKTILFKAVDAGLALPHGYRL